MRTARDAVLRIGRDDLAEPPPARGEHDPTVDLGLETLPADHSGLMALREAIGALSGGARRELRALLWIGRGEGYAAADWDEALAAAQGETRDVSIGILTDEVDLHHFLMKGLYELRLA